jgi:hypothetical protein
MTVFEKRPLQRVRYWQGQMLRSGDFRAQNADTAQHRWWHNRALHNAYGVYQGLNSSANVSSGGVLTSVSVAAGVGYDCFGRELIVDGPQTVMLPVNVPRPPTTMVLLIRYEAGEDCQSQTLEEICWTRSSEQSSGTVSFTWMPLDRVQLRDGVPLGRVIYDGRGGRSLSPTFVPPGARPIARPAIATGATLPATTAWEPWTISAPTPATGALLSQVEVGVQAVIDTSAAGFTRTPCYFAWLAGSLFNPNTQQLLPDMFPSLANESANRFTFQMWFPPAPPQGAILQMRASRALATSGAGVNVISDPKDFFPFARQQKLYVQWVACQMPPALPFVPLRLRILNEWLLPFVLQKVALVRNLIK